VIPALRPRRLAAGLCCALLAAPPRPAPAADGETPRPVPASVNAPAATDAEDERASSPGIAGSPAGPRHGRACRLLALGFLAGSAVYLGDERNTADYDYELEFATLRPKFLTLEAWRFDDNEMWINSPGHPLAGAWYYLVGRVCGFNRLASSGLLLAGNLLWESTVEFREVTSINDLVLTIGGVAVGEAVWQAGPRGDTGARGRVEAEAGAGIRGIGGRAGARPAAALRLRSPDDAWPRTCRGTRLILDGAADNEGIADAYFFAEATLAGWNSGDVVGSARGGRWGHKVFAGAATGYEQSCHRYDGADRHAAVVNLLGPALRLAWHGGRLDVRAALDLYGDFAQVDAHALETYGAEHDLNGVKSPLKKWGYYNAAGGTARPSLTFAAPPFELGWEARYHGLRSIQGRDRRQEEVTDDAPLSDNDLRQAVTAAWTTPWRATRVRLRYEEALRQGQMGDARRASADATLSLTVGHAF